MNARDELIKLLKELNVTLECGYVEDIRYDIPEKSRRKFILPVSYSEQTYKDFIDDLDFSYDDGYGIEELGGVLWFTDGTWASRGEYDGSEWWEHHTRPEIPVELRGADTSAK